MGWHVGGADSRCVPTADVCLWFRRRFTFRTILVSAPGMRPRATTPSEAVMLKEADRRLPGRGWGRIDLAASAARVGKDRTDDGAAR